MRVEGEAFQRFSGTGFSRSCERGYVWISRRGFPASGPPAGLRMTMSGRSVSPCSETVAFSD